MSPNKKLIFADALLIGSCAYAIISGSLSGKKFAIVGVAIFLGSGILSIANEVTSNNNISKCDEHVYYVAEISCIDLIVTDICIMSSVDTKLAALFLVPPIIDLIMKYAVDNSWEPITKFTHIISVGAMIFFGFRDTKYILFVGALGFALAVFSTQMSHQDYIRGFHSLGVFASSWFLGGKDLKDMGINVG